MTVQKRKKNTTVRIKIETVYSAVLFGYETRIGTRLTKKRRKPTLNVV